MCRTSSDSHNCILNRGFIQQQTKLLPDPQLANHTWQLIKRFPDYDQHSFDYIDGIIAKLPEETATTLMAIFWVLGCLHETWYCDKKASFVPPGSSFD